jgi:hypothetical protein
MNRTRIFYRTRQFWQAARSTSTPQDLDLARRHLPPSLWGFFLKLQPNDQQHSLRVLQALLDRNENNASLCQAALLHDIGKTRLPLRLWERALIVLVAYVCPGCVGRWGQQPEVDLESIPAWRRAFTVAAQHPQWGAEMAERGGASPLTVNLIRRHQEKVGQDGGTSPSGSPLEEILLRKLQAADDNC